MEVKRIEGFWIFGNPQKSISAQNPYIVYTDLYQKLINDYGKELGEKYLWALFLLLDPSCNILWQMPRVERERKIALYYFEDAEFDWEPVLRYAPDYRKEFLTRSKKNLSAISNAIDKFNERMENFDPEISSELKVVSAIIKNTKDNRNTLFKDEEEFQQDKKAATEILFATRGNVVLGPEEAEHFKVHDRS